MAKGRIEIDIERCKGCELCRSACPPNVIEVSKKLNSKGYWPVYLAENDKSCTGCALCAVICPEGCITVYRTITPKKVMACMAT